MHSSTTENEKAAWAITLNQAALPRHGVEAKGRNAMNEEKKTVSQHIREMGQKRFILLNEDLPPSERGVDGAIGRVSADNVYLTAYPQWPTDAPAGKTLLELEVGEEIRAVKYNLNGTKGKYTVRRVE